MFLEIAFVSALLATASCTPAHVRQQVPHAFKFLGSANGASYYLDETVQRNWTDAIKHCDDSNMTLASIRSQEVLDLLKTSIAELRFSTWLSFWTAAAEVIRRHRTTWVEELGLDVEMEMALDWELDINPGLYAYCGTIDSLPNEPQPAIIILTRPCYEADYGVICSKEDDESKADLLRKKLPAEGRPLREMESRQVYDEGVVKEEMKVNGKVYSRPLRIKNLA